MKSGGFPLTMYFDGICPLCIAEVKQLRTLDTDGNLRFEDIHAQDFINRYPHINREAANRVLHAEYADGRLLLGLDVTQHVWRAVDKNHWLALLRWPIIRWFADMVYWIFARYRYSISYLLTGIRRCDSCAIKLPGEYQEKP